MVEEHGEVLQDYLRRKWGKVMFFTILASSIPGLYAFLVVIQLGSGLFTWLLRLRYAVSSDRNELGAS